MKYSEPWGWRIEIDIPDDNRVTISQYNISPAGEEALGVQTDYRRVNSS